MKTNSVFPTKIVREFFEYDPRGFLLWKRGNYRGRKVGWVQSKPREYLVCQFRRKKLYVHRLIFQWHHGHCPPILDHIDSNGLNNKIENLRPATASQNMYNRKAGKNNTSGQKGVYFCSTTKKWVAQIQISKKRRTLGSFETLSEATKAYQIEARKNHKEFFKTRGPLSI